MAQTHSLDLELGSSQSASITDASQTGLDLSTDYSIEAWIKLESLPASNTTMQIVSKDKGGTDRSYYFSYEDASGTKRFNILNYTSSSTAVLVNYTLSTGTWYHVAVTRKSSDGDTLIYLDGTQIGSGTGNTGALNDSTAQVVVGGRDSGSGILQQFDGLIKDVRVFSDIRTAAEIASDAATESVSDANLQAEWNFNNAYTDASGNSNTLTANGSPVFSTNLPWKENSIRFGNIGPVSTSSSYTSLSVIGPEMIGIVYVVGDTSDNITAVTWDGSSMTKIAAVQTPSDRFSSAWYILDPSAGESTIAFTGGSFWRSIASYYRSAKQSGQVDSSNTGTSSASTTIAVATTVVAANSWTVMMQKDNSGSLSYTTDVGVIRADSDAGGIAISDSNGTVSTGSQTTTLTSSSSKHGAIHISIAPSALAGPANVKSWNGVAIADIKSINGLAKADIKSINGLA